MAETTQPQPEKTAVMVPNVIYEALKELAEQTGKSIQMVINEILSVRANDFLSGQIVAYRKCGNMTKENKTDVNQKERV